MKTFASSKQPINIISPCSSIFWNVHFVSLEILFLLTCYAIIFSMTFKNALTKRNRRKCNLQIDVISNMNLTCSIFGQCVVHGGISEIWVFWCVYLWPFQEKCHISCIFKQNINKQYPSEFIFNTFSLKSNQRRETSLRHLCIFYYFSCAYDLLVGFCSTGHWT